MFIITKEEKRYCSSYFSCHSEQLPWKKKHTLNEEPFILAHVSEEFCPLWCRGKYGSRSSIVLRKDNHGILLSCLFPCLFSLRPGPWDSISHIHGRSLGPSEKKFKDAQRCHCVITNSVKLSVNLTTTGVGRSARKRLKNEKCYFYRHPTCQNSSQRKNPPSRGTGNVVFLCA